MHIHVFTKVLEHFVPLCLCPLDLLGQGDQLILVLLLHGLHALLSELQLVYQLLFDVDL